MPGVVEQYVRQKQEDEESARWCQESWAEMQLLCYLEQSHRTILLEGETRSESWEDDDYAYAASQAKRDLKQLRRQFPGRTSGQLLAIYCEMAGLSCPEIPEM